MSPGHWMSPVYEMISFLGTKGQKSPVMAETLRRKYKEAVRASFLCVRRGAENTGGEKL